jgi:hypothetical protein
MRDLPLSLRLRQAFARWLLRDVHLGPVAFGEHSVLIANDHIHFQTNGTPASAGQFASNLSTGRLAGFVGGAAADHALLSEVQAAGSISLPYSVSTLLSNFVAIGTSSWLQTSSRQPAIIGGSATTDVFEYNVRALTPNNPTTLFVDLVVLPRAAVAIGGSGPPTVSFVVTKNGVDTALSCAFGNGDSAAVRADSNVSFTPTDSVGLRVELGGTVTSGSFDVDCMLHLARVLP